MMDLSIKWIAHPIVLTASLLSRGFWLSILPQLVEGGGAIPRGATEVTRNLGLSGGEAERTLAELGSLLECSEDEVRCPTLAHDLNVREKRRVSGRKGGYPTWRRAVAGPLVKQLVVQKVESPYSVQSNPPSPPLLSTPAALSSVVADEQDEPQLFDASEPALRGPEAAFELFWEAYPTKVGKGAARGSFHRKRLHKQIKVLLEAIAIQKTCRRWTEGYIPNPATWLNQERWLDDHQKPFTRLKAQLGEFPDQFHTWLRHQPQWAARRWDTYRAVDRHIREAFEEWERLSKVQSAV